MGIARDLCSLSEGFVGKMMLGIDRQLLLYSILLDTSTSLNARLLISSALDVKIQYCLANMINPVGLSKLYNRVATSMMRGDKMRPKPSLQHFVQHPCIYLVILHRVKCMQSINNSGTRHHFWNSRSLLHVLQLTSRISTVPCDR